MNEIEKKIRQKLKDDFVHYASKCLSIRTKSGDIKPFELNEAQLLVHNTVQKQILINQKVRIIILKGRQQGMSTYVGGRIYWRISHRFGVKAFILTHEAEATNNLFEMTQRYHQYCPQVVRPETSASSAKELYFGLLDSGYKVGTAGNKSVGRSSTIQYFHGSEVAFWPNAAEHAKGILQAVPNDAGTEIFLESTANGIGNYFHEQWQIAEAGQSDFIPIFVPWYLQKEYVREVPRDFQVLEDEIDLIRLYHLNPHQLMWRRYKIQELSVSGGDGRRAFNQEYPNNPTEAFSLSGDDTLIHPDIVMRARKEKCEKIGPLIVGCDPARYGDDRTSIIYRRGRCAYNLKSYSKKNTMEVTGILHNIIIKENPDFVCIDVGGLGAGIIDRLLELGHDGRVIAVNSGESALDQDKYINKRAEMWGEAKNWLIMAPVEIPDSDSLHADLCAPKYEWDSINRLKIESKEKMKRRGLRSPDEADAFCLTFALPKTIHKSKNQSESIARDMMSASMKLSRVRSRK